MSGASPEDIFLSTSLASYLDSTYERDGGGAIETSCVTQRWPQTHGNPSFIRSIWFAYSFHMIDGFGTSPRRSFLKSTEIRLGKYTRGWMNFEFSHIQTNLVDSTKANAVLEGACDRVIVGELYCDIPLGLYVIRGENVVLIGELTPNEEELPPHMTRVSVDEIRQAQKVEMQASELKGTMRKRMEFLDMD
ncbi:hypothetical protein Leryth_022603 [Lithospermum erythrorhizon]|nr:hypothetical protein Leryth_022603 [Lithospermum erythrorhizon]